MQKKNPFWQNNTLFASKDKINVFLVEGSRRVPEVKKKFEKTLILVFEVIVQPLKHTFEIALFSTLEKSYILLLILIL